MKDLLLDKTERNLSRANARTINLQEWTKWDRKKEEIVHRVSLIALAIPSAFDRCAFGSRGIACEWQKPLQRGSSGSRATAQSNHEDARKECILAFLGNVERAFRQQRLWQLVEQVSRSSPRKGSTDEERDAREDSSRYNYSPWSLLTFFCDTNAREHDASL